MFALPDYMPYIYPNSNSTSSTTFIIYTTNSGSAATNWSATTYNTTLGQIGSFSVPPLNQGIWNRNDAVVPCSPGQIVTLFAKVDATGNVTESNEANNVKNATGYCIDPTWPNLKPVVNLSYFQNRYVGVPFTAPITTLNDGQTSAGASLTRVYFYTGGIFENYNLTVPALAPGQSNTTVLTLTCHGTSSGYVAIGVDNTTVIYETNESDNTWSLYPFNCVNPPQLPDLVASAPAADLAGNKTVGVQFSVRINTTNIGNVTAGVSTTRVIFSGSSQYIAVPALNAGFNNMQTVNVTCTTPGQNTFQLSADFFNNVSESSEDNNNWVYVNVNCVAPQLPNLVPQVNPAQLAGQKIVGVPFTVNVTTLNNGAGAAGASITNVRLSNWNSINLGVPPLSAGASNTSVVSLTCQAAGTAWFIASVDNTTLVTESNEADNTIWYTVNCTAAQQPDLIVTTNISSTPLPGGHWIAVTLRNIGSASAGASIVRTWYGGSAHDMAFLALGAGSQITMNRPVSCNPVNTAFNATADFFSNVSESNENNNNAAPLTVPACCRVNGMDCPANNYCCSNICIGGTCQSCLPLGSACLNNSQCCSEYCNGLTNICEEEPELQPDLVISALIVPRSMAQGRTYGATVTTRNTGQGTSVPSTTRVTYGGRVVAAVPVPALDPNDQLQAEFSMSCTGLENSDGVSATADYGNVSAESNENNNGATGRSLCIRRANATIDRIEPVPGPGGIGEVGAEDIGNAEPKEIGKEVKEAGAEKEEAAKEEKSVEEAKTSRSESILNSAGLGFVDDFFAWLGSLLGGK
jgi:subtilase family serine protease